MKTKWTLTLLILAIIDSITTVYIFGVENNPSILWVMDTFDINLKMAMIIRILYYIPFLVILDRTNWSRFTFFAYIGIYFSMFWMSFI